MRVLAPRVPSFDELYKAVAALPEGVTGEILEPGIIRTMSRPAGPHRFAARQVVRQLRGHDASEGGKGWWIELEVEIRFPDDRLAVPDLCGWHTDAVPPAFVRQNPIREVPQWACEILSRSTETADRELKLPMFALHGVGHVWMVDPEARRIEVYESRRGAPELVADAKDDGVVTLPPFGTAIALSELWLPEPR